MASAIAELNSYQAHKERAAQRQRALTSKGRDIGPAWPVSNPKRRAKALKSLAFFLKAYFPEAFKLPWSEDHLRAIERIERSAIEGGLFALAMPRGTGKTSILERATIWVILKGIHRFAAILGASETHAARMLSNIKLELWLNDLLAADFPEVCHPIRALNNEARRCIGQTWSGVNTSIGWGQNEVVMPLVPEGVASHCAGSIIISTGITGSIRGHSKTMATGAIIRPSFVLIDDPQTRESANSESQCRTREAIVSGDVLGMAGPGQKISAVMPCTVIRKGDMADAMLDRKSHPDWNGERTKMVYAFPTNQALWDQYAEIRAQALREDRPATEATDFYRANRKAMDEGSVVAWKERKAADELSAIQHAMNLLFRDRAAFFAEYQNDPIEERSDAEQMMTADQVQSKLSGVERGRVSNRWNKLTAFVDVQKEVLFWMVCGWADDFSGGVLDYGVFPDQGLNYFTLDALSAKLSTKFVGQSTEAAIFSGLTALTSAIAQKDWQRDDGTAARVSRLLIDSGWQTDLVYQFCRQSPHAGLLKPSKGRFIGASSKALNEYQRKAGDRVGLNWREPSSDGKVVVRHIIFDSNFWKSFVLARLATTMGTPGCLALYGQEASRHRMIADHLTSEYGVKTEGRGRTCIEWKLKPNRPDNHWLDCLVGCAVAASEQGVSLLDSRPPVTKPKGKFSDMQKAKMGMK